ncbi:hypothetical protein GF377_03055 [candidate division GN15 bacterium]|nr:hypothetical protein [candidate division GN15 bacterium]
MDVAFGDIIKRSFEIAWRYKSLWIFGLFTYGASQTYNFDIGSEFEVDPQLFQGFEGQFSIENLPFQFNESIIAALVLWALFLGLLFFICYLIAMPALIDAINNITRGGEYRFNRSFSRGLDFFLRFLGLNIMWFVIIVAAVIIVAVLAFVTPFTLILTIPLFIVLGFVLFMSFSLGEVAMVARDISIFDALGEGLTLIKHNLLNCILMALIYIGIAVGLSIVVGLVTAMVFLPINLILASIIGDVVTLIILGLFVGLPVSLVLGGYLGTFFNSLLIQFYFYLVDPPQPQAQPVQPAG